MNRASLRRAAVFAIGSFALIACNGGAQRGQLERSLETALVAAANTNAPVVRIGQVARFEWDRLFLFHPYTPGDKIDAALGYRWASPAKADIESDDAFELLVFAKGGRVVQHARVRRSLGDWEIGDRNGFPRDRAEFQVSQSFLGLRITPLSAPPVRK